MRFAMIALLFVTPAYAGELIVEETPSPPNSFVTVKYKLDKGDSVLFDVYPEPVKVREHTDSEYAYVHFNGPIQKYSVNASIVNFDSKKFTKKRESVVIGGNVPPVPPGPVPPTPPGPLPPNPDPPKPIVEYDAPIRLFIVEETSNRTTESTKIILDVDYWNGLEKSGYIMRPYDISSADSKRLGLDKIKQPLPFIVVSDKVGNVIGSYPLPMSREGINKVLPAIKTKLNLDAPIPLPTVQPVRVSVPLTSDMHSHVCDHSGTRFAGQPSASWSHSSSSRGSASDHTCPVCGKLNYNPVSTGNTYTLPSSMLGSDCPTGNCPTGTTRTIRKGIFR